MAYAALQNLSSYSLLQSTTTIPQLISNAKQKGYQTLALTDQNVLYGAVAFYQTAIKEGLHPIIGLELTVAGSVSVEHHYQLLLLARNQNGYQHLLQLSTLKMTQSAPLAWQQLTPELLQGLFILLPETSEVNSLISYQRIDQAQAALQELLAVAAPETIKLGVTPTISNEELQLRTKLTADNHLELIALQETQYLQAEDAFYTHVLQSIATGSTMSDINQTPSLGSNWLPPVELIEQKYQNRGLVAALEVNAQVAAACQVEIIKQAPQLPTYQTPNAQPAVAYLRRLCQAGLQKRLSNQQADNSKYQQRLDHELDVIERMGFSDYFLIVWDVINFAHQHHILTGPGRGSAAGSLVSYCLKITDVDPIKYDLLFERFLNEERAQMPDIDLDIPDEQREIILQYVHDKYGNDRVAQIITFGTLGAKQALRDTGRVFGLPVTTMNRWSAAIPKQLHETLTQAEKESQKLRNLLADSDTNRKLFETAQKIEGLPRHYSTHAAGLILSDEPIVKKAPLQNGNEGLLMTQYSKYYVEDVGLLKIDFLGLRNLSIMNHILTLVHQQFDAEFDVTKISLEDERTLQLFQAGKTNGVFQFESAGIKNVLRRMHPDSFELIAAVNALYRPGPMENIDTFIARKDGLEAVDYPNQTIKEILSSTYGIIVYQEQVMQLAAAMAGFSLAQADVLRRAMSKKHHQEMESMRQRFMQGALAKKYSEQTATTTFDYIERFASYGFNKSHAVAYSKMAFELAYLKVHFPGPFFVALLNSVVGNFAKIKTYIQEAKDNDLSVLNPSLNHSNADFTYQQGSIRFGFQAIKGLRSDFIKEILALRKEQGNFTSLVQFVQQLPPKFQKEDQLQALAYTGALDEFGYNRHEVVAALPKILSSAEFSGSLLADLPGMEVEISHKPDFQDWEKTNFENEYLGTYLSGHPVERYEELRKKSHAIRTSDLQPTTKTVKLILLISHIKTVRTKRGQLMAFINAGDQFTTIDLTIFPQLYREISSWLKPNIVVLVQGTVEERRGLQLIVNQIEPAANASRVSGPVQQKLFIRLNEANDQPAQLQQLQQYLVSHQGDCPVVLYRVKTDQKQLLPSKYRVKATDAVLQHLQGLFGAANVVLQ
ncbi:DNA polymerase III subunit alpha [Fructilactobacillus florum]|uniref:DNA polymerase III subunit alpha n=1 Tax=Fructilactobacillus florum DSM 22689 = JCM 16035 TaxID=1423745 RepID=A0A0R2CJH5_9LACO|nr:DNA polymerase III subunit alpha [Fructilactobacillus florum]KRM91434.1 hypothetical protein FC87_GL000945 [Fructilactobacillus florum DSM 22689 = JCM 16035]